MRKLKIFAAAMAAVLALSAVPAVSAQAAGEHKLAALTFDDGPGPYTEQLLDGLRERGVQATFFVLGSRAQMYPEVVERISQEGHQLGNHSYSHANLNKLSVSAALKEMTGTDGILYDITGGGSPYFYRVPYGNSTGALRDKFGSPAVFWSVDTLDWKYRDASQVASNIKRDIKDGSIVLLHDIHKTSVQGVLMAIDDLQRDGYEFVTVRELYRRRGVEMKAGGSYYSCPATGVDLGAVEAPVITTKGVPGGLQVTIEAQEGVQVYYSTDGSPIGFDGKKYDGSFVVEVPCTVRAVAAVHINGSRSREVTATFDRPQAQNPQVAFSGSRVTFTPAENGDKVYYRIGEEEYKEAQGPVGITRGDTIYYYALGEDTVPSQEEKLYLSRRGLPMADVDSVDWFCDAMDWAASEGYIEADENFEYGPNGTVTRGELARLLYKIQGSPYSDGIRPLRMWIPSLSTPGP